MGYHSSSLEWYLLFVRLNRECSDIVGVSTSINCDLSVMKSCECVMSVLAEQRTAVPRDIRLAPTTRLVERSLPSPRL